VKFTSSYKIVPDLAESWELSSDGLKLTFHLAKDVKWHDGTKFSSEDVKWTFDTIIAQKGISSGSFTNVERIECEDKNTVSFILNAPDSSLLSSLSKLGVFIMPKHKYEGQDWLTNETNFAPVGTGPFKFNEWSTGESMTLVKNDDYFVTTPKLDKVIYKYIPDENTAWLAWMNDEIDCYDTYPYTEVKKLEGDDQYEIVERLTANITYVAFQTKTEPFQDVAVRRAFAAAIDKNELLSTAYQGVGNIAKYPIPSVYNSFTNDSIKLPEHDVGQSKSILEEAGYERDSEGYYLTIDLEYFDLGQFTEAAEILRNQLQKAGINLNLKQMEYTTWQESVVNHGEFTCTLLNGNQGPTIYDTINRFSPSSSTNISGYDSDEISQFISEATSSGSDKELMTAFEKIQKQLVAEIPNLNLIEKVEFVPLKSKIKGHPLTDSIDIASPEELTYVYFD